ncbi:MAG: carboxypeptidase regulatory-like domain-containing protein [Pirellulaceae bacterium]|nr:carboxypeptidase regulatory-like domain-containing protein [Pirellulaceae bacterium]
MPSASLTPAHSVLLLALATCLAGCEQTDANLGLVSGRVTLDGEPLAAALVVFSPVEQGGSQSLGKTDADGKYVLNFAPGLSGAQLGRHTISITTFEPAAPDADPPIAGSPERVPAKYNLKTELVREVQPGENTHDFELAARP